MGLFTALKRLFRRKQEEEALSIDAEALQKRSEALTDAIRSAANRIGEKKIEEEKTLLKAPEEVPKPSPPIELQKDSLQLGIAAGYTGKFIRDVESSLNRIETQMVTKDWFISQFEDKTPELIEIMKKHDQEVKQRFKALQSSVESLKHIAEISPKPIKTKLQEEIKKIEAQLSLTNKMQELLEIVKEFKEISYKDLADRLNLSTSSLRALLSKMVNRTDKIERFKKGKAGWVRYTEAIRSAAKAL